MSEVTGKVDVNSFVPTNTQSQRPQYASNEYDEKEAEVELAKILDEFEALVISYITDFLNLQQVYEPGLPNSVSPGAYNMDKKLQVLTNLLKQFDPETQQLLQIQVLVELHAKQGARNLNKRNPCLRPLAEVQELVLQFRSDMREMADKTKRKGGKGPEQACGVPNMDRKSRLSQFISDLKNCLTISYEDVATRDQEKSAAPPPRSSSDLPPLVRLPSPRVIPATHYKRVFDRIKQGDQACGPCTSVYDKGRLWKRYQMPPGPYEPLSLPPIPGIKPSPPINALTHLTPKAYELMVQSQTKPIPYHLDPTKYRLLSKKANSVCCPAGGDTNLEANFTKMLNNQNSGIESFEDTMRAYTKLSNSIPLIWAGFGPGDEPLLFPATGLTCSQLPINPNITMGGIPWMSRSNFAKFGIDGNPILGSQAGSSTSFLSQSIDSNDDYYDQPARRRSRSHSKNRNEYEQGYHGGMMRKGNMDTYYDKYGVKRTYSRRRSNLDADGRSRAISLGRNGKGRGRYDDEDGRGGGGGRNGGRNRRNKSDDPETYRSDGRRKGGRFDDDRGGRGRGRGRGQSRGGKRGQRSRDGSPTGGGPGRRKKGHRSRGGSPDRSGRQRNRDGSTTGGTGRRKKGQKNRDGFSGGTGRRKKGQRSRPGSAHGTGHGKKGRTKNGSPDSKDKRKKGQDKVPDQGADEKLKGRGKGGRRSDGTYRESLGEDGEYGRRGKKKRSDASNVTRDSDDGSLDGGSQAGDGSGRTRRGKHWRRRKKDAALIVEQAKVTARAALIKEKQVSRALLRKLKENQSKIQNLGDGDSGRKGPVMKIDPAVYARLTQVRTKKDKAPVMDENVIRPTRKAVPKFTNPKRRIRPPDPTGVVIGGSGDDQDFYPLSRLDKDLERHVLLKRAEGDEEFSVNSVNAALVVASQIFKKPTSTLHVPPPVNLLSFIENKYPKLKWAKGPPRAVRYYPNGDIFCASFKNGSGVVFYPHGGLAIAISSPSPFNHVIILRDPYDKYYFAEKSILADFNCVGKGAVFDPEGFTQLQYNTLGGFRNDGIEKMAQRWQWNRGGQRMIVKLNGYMSLRILDLNRIVVNFYGNKRGLRFNVGPDNRVISLIKINPPGKTSRRPEPIFPDNYDYHRGKFNAPRLGFLDMNKQVVHVQEDLARPQDQGDHLPELAFAYSFRQCEDLDNHLPPLQYDCMISQCAMNPPGTAFLC